MQIQSVAFKREEQSDWEKGIMIHNEDIDANIIIDMNAKALESVWDYEYEFYLIVSFS